MVRWQDPSGTEDLGGLGSGGTDEPAAQGHSGTSGMTASSHYEMLVQGVLDEHWAAWFGGLLVSNDGDQTVICGTVTDQAALHGLLTKVHDLGLVLISVRRIDPA